MSSEFTLELHSESQKNIVKKWLGLAVASLLGAGLFSLLLVLSRTPGVQDIIPWIDFFHVALVVHVDLSVLIWFLSMAGVFWTIGRPNSGGRLDIIAWWTMVSGTLVMVVCPFFGVGQPLLNNYVPVLQHPVFYLALLLVALGVSCVLINTIRHPPFLSRAATTSVPGVQVLACYLAAIATLFSFVALCVSYFTIPDTIVGEYYFELLFWGAGHTLQFTHTIFLLLAWLVLVSAIGAEVSVKKAVLAGKFVLAAVPIVFVPWIYLTTEVDSLDHRLGFTKLMQYGGLACLPLGAFAIFKLVQSPKAQGHQRPLKAAMIASFILFSAGGIIGFLIEGVNVVIPAHYHGSIVGITLAFMGVAYLLLPKLGLGYPHQRLATWQPYVYGGGQLMHILGLAWSGGYGVQRKTAGAAQGLDRLPEVVGMGMMGLGGLISTIGGLLFLIVMYKAWKGRGEPAPSAS